MLQVSFSGQPLMITKKESRAAEQHGFVDGGEGGIRTHGGREDHNGFRDRPDRPLWHLSK